MPREACCQPGFTAAGAEAESGGVTRWGHAAFRWNRGDCTQAVWPQSYSTWLLGSVAFTSTFLFQFSHYSPQNSLFFFLWELKLRPLLIEMLGEPSLLTLLYTHQRASGLCLPKRTQSRGMGSLAHSFTHSFVRLLFCSLSEYFSANFIPDTVSHVGHIAVDWPTSWAQGAYTLAGKTVTK